MALYEDVFLSTSPILFFTCKMKTIMLCIDQSYRTCHEKPNQEEKLQCWNEFRLNRSKPSQLKQRSRNRTKSGKGFLFELIRISGPKVTP